MAIDVLKQIWPEWQIEEKPLGKGSYGVVYKAVRRDHNVESFAAIKVISIPADSSEVESLRSEGLDMSATKTYLHGIVNDFVSEIQLMESLKGVQNIVSVEDYKVIEKENEIGWDIYIRMELLTPFNTYICDKKMTEEEVIKLGCDICTALEICGKRNVIHRDIKPENIFINDFGYFKLGDFGIARKMENMTGGLSQKGTFNYMAPEVATSTDYDARVDTYSLGIVLYRLLNGNRLPFLDTEAQLMNPNERRAAVERRIHGENLPAPCDASPEMADVILKACAFNPAMRFASATEMKQALMAVANGTYCISGVADMDKTTAIIGDVENNATEKFVSDNSDATTAIRKNPAYNQGVQQYPVNTPQKKKSASGTIAIILAILCLIIIIGLAIVIIPALTGSKDKDDDDRADRTSQVDEIEDDDDEKDDSSKDDKDSSSSSASSNDYTEFDKQQIASIISEADELAAQGNYRDALTKVQTALSTYPEAEELSEKAEEYTEAMNAQIKETTLSEAAQLADSGDYLAAMELIENAQETYGDDADYQSAYETYSKAYVTAVKTDAIMNADALASNGDYLGAVAVIKEAKGKIGEDAELTEKAQSYENSYANNVSAKVDSYLAANDLESARELLQTASANFPNNEIISARQDELDSYKTVPLDTLTPINGGFTWNDGTPEDPFGNTYADLQNYVIFHADSNYSGVHCYEQSYSAEYQINNQYDIIEFTITPYSDFGESAWSYIQIYTDNVLRYTSDQITQKTQPYDISVDISSATYIKIVARIGGYGCSMLTDVVLSSSPNFVSTIPSGYTSLSTLDIFNGTISWNSGFPSDTLEASYNNVQNYSILHADSNYSGVHCYDEIYSAEYYTNKQYSSISLNIAPKSDFGASASSYIKIYADDVLIYTSPTIEQKTARFNTGAIDISNATYIKIVGEIGGYGCTIISDVLLKNAN